MAKQLNASEITIKGKVQGVYFRKNTKKKADELKITGYVRNEKDGAVFVHAEGTQSKLLNFIKWCSIGEGKAEVEEIKCSWIKPTGVYSSFEVINPIESAVNILSNIILTSTHQIPKDTIIPKHLAIIPLGTRRWARNRNIDVLKGYTVAAQAINDLLECLPSANIKYLTILALSQDIWKLPTKEIEAVLNDLDIWIKELKPTLQKNQIRFSTIGRTNRLPKSIRQNIETLEKHTKNNKKLIFTFGIDYSGRDEILRTYNKAIQKDLPSMDDKSFVQFCDTANIPDPDILVVTGGRRSVNDFLLWQINRTHIHFTSKDFPDFTCDDLKEIVIEYSDYQKLIKSKI